jgi:serine/threonine-protein kinase
MTTDKKMIGPYEILGVIGSGGMGVVYRGILPPSKRFVAIKVLPAHLAQNREFVERFLREARSVASLEHPSIVSIYDIGESEGAYYFVMKLLVGDTLDEYIAEEGRVPLAKALLFTGQLADALGTAHASGVIHRDVKPANIIVGPREQRVVLTDFGIALTLEETRLTRPGAMFGSPIYIAPEQLEGDDVDHRADFYSLGSVLYQMLAGRPPYEADLPVAILHQRIREPERSVRDINPEVPLSVDRLVRRLMARNPDDRFQTAAEILEALRELGEEGHQPGVPVEAEPTLMNGAGSPGESRPETGRPAQREVPADVPDEIMAAASPPAAQSLPADVGSTTQRLIRKVGVRRIILAWIGVMAAVLIVLMAVIWWNRSSASGTGEVELQAELVPALDQEAAGEQAAEEDPERTAAGDGEDPSTGPASAGPEKGAGGTVGGSAEQTGRSAEPPASGAERVDRSAVTETVEGKTVRPTEVAPAKPAEETAEKPPSGTRTTPRAPAAPSVTEAEVASALAAARTSRESAEQAGAPEHAPLPWAAGEEKLRAGDGHRSDKRSDLEQRAYEEARAHFDQAMAEAAPAAEAARKEQQAGQGEVEGLATRIEQGISAGTAAGLEDAGLALGRFREIAPQDSRLARFSTRLEEADKRLWQTHGMDRTFAIARGVEMAFIWVPPGTFRMGTTTKKKSTHTDEGPKHTVVISKGFWMGTFEVTQAQWQAVMGGNPSSFVGADRPVDRISWNDALAFVSKLNAAAGSGQFRLPTEAEWEFVCRAGSTRSFYGGEINTVDCRNEDHLAPWGWYCYNSGDTTHAVGQLQPNGWGFYDMHGNVGEWCSDYYDQNYYEYSPTRDPQGPDSGRNRVLRGGGWDSRAWDCRSANRGRYGPGAKNNSFGLRIVRTAD